MKKISCLLMLALLAPSFALAKGNHPMAGCGPAYVLFGHQNNNKGTQIGAYLVHYLLCVNCALPISSSMSSGTSGCAEDGAPAWVRAVEIFAEANYDTLKKEMAFGQGEYVSTFASLLGAPQEKVSDLVSLMKQEYASLIPSDAATHIDLLKNLSHLLVSHRDLIS